MNNKEIPSVEFTFLEEVPIAFSSVSISNLTITLFPSKRSPMPVA